LSRLTAVFWYASTAFVTLRSPSTQPHWIWTSSAPFWQLVLAFHLSIGDHAHLALSHGVLVKLALHLHVGLVLLDLQLMVQEHQPFLKLSLAFSHRNLGLRLAVLRGDVGLSLDGFDLRLLLKPLLVKLGLALVSLLIKLSLHLNLLHLRIGRRRDRSGCRVVLIRRLARIVKYVSTSF
jgi:hypothetical protein